MNIVNSSQVQSTNDASTTSKYSAASKNYFSDNFIQEFAGKKKSRVSLINLGYYTRAVILFKLIQNFIEFVKQKDVLKFQIVSCGAGFDTTYWRLSERKLLDDLSLFIEIDFPDVVRNKLELISHSTLLQSFTEYRDEDVGKAVNRLNKNYFLVEADLSNLYDVESRLNEIPVQYEVPTLFISECVITYMTVDSSDELIAWMARKFENGSFLNYEQIHPSDGFGQVMLKHFDKLQSCLFSVKTYPDCMSHRIRYKNLGFEKSLAVSEWDAFCSLETDEDRLRAVSRELFDEFEEFHMKCVHYVVGLAGSRMGATWIESLPFVPAPPLTGGRKFVQVETVPVEFELYRHCSFAVDDQMIYLFGGCKKESRSSDVYRFDVGLSTVRTVPMHSAKPEIQLDLVYGNVVHFELNRKRFCCLYGGRTSPNKISNDGAMVLLEVSDGGDLIPRLRIENETQVRQYRSSMVACANGSDQSVDLWIFGGRSAELGRSTASLLRLTLTTGTAEFDRTWKVYEERSQTWPCSRMSHGMTSVPDRSCFYVSCGLTTDSSTVLNDLWKWCCKSETWEKCSLSGDLLPRYGHTSHLVGSDLFLVGGVNTRSGTQPGLAKINLDTFAVTEFSLQFSGPGPVLLFNHTSELLRLTDKVRILVLGGGGNCFSFGTYLNGCLHAIDVGGLT